jgi:hypothetical protein
VTGYSPRSLPEKLGIRPGTRVVALKAPQTYAAILGELPEGTTVRGRLPSRTEFLHCFARRRAELTQGFPRWAKALADNGTLWVSWPKRAAGLETDLTENVVREIGLTQGLVDVKVCAIDAVWSGLKFVRRVANRGGRA